MPKALVDVSDSSVIVCCDSCPWRAIAGSRGGAWKAAALHFKQTHGDLQAARRASHCAIAVAARHSRKRDQSRESGNRGNQGRNQSDRARTGDDRGSA